MQLGGKGTVYLVVQVGPDGKVMNVGAQQVNLRAVGTPAQMEQVRSQLTEASIAAARRWRFNPPTTGKEAHNDSWLAIMPVTYIMWNERVPKADQWDTYVPGPINYLPWAQEDDHVAGSPSALPDDGLFPLRQGARLLTPPAS